jgi:hypothetical protein
MRNKTVKLIGSCLLVLLMGCQHNQEPKPMQMVAHLKEHEVLNVTDGLTAEYENIKKTQYEKYHFKYKYSLPIDEFIPVGSGLQGNHWGEYQYFVVTGDGTRFEKCEFAKQWYSKHKDKIIEIAYKANTNTWAFVLVQDESLYKKEIADDNGLSEHIFKVEYIRRYKTAVNVMSITDCAILLKQDVV